MKMMKKTFTCLKKVGSTNAFLLDIPEAERDGRVVYAHEQCSGKGMGANTWESQPGMNLTFSMGVDMSFMKAADQFLLSQAVPLGLIDELDRMVPPGNLMLKWPNDLLYGNGKLGGILINSTLHGSMMGVSVIGIGLNVNQTQFQPWPTHPISLKTILGEETALEPLLYRLVDAVDLRVGMLRTMEGIERIKKDYLKRLFRYRQWADYEVDGLLVRRFVTGLDSFGHLVTLDEDGAQHVYGIKEIKITPPFPRG